MSLLTGCSKLLTTSLAHLSSLAPVSLCPEHLKTNAKMPPLPTSSATRKETKGAAEAQALLLDLTLFFLQACLCSSLPWALGSLLIFCFYCQFIFYSLFCRTKMDAKKPRKCSLTSFPNLKTRKKENLGFVKVRILEFNWGKRMASSWRLGDPGPIGDCCVPSTFDNKMRGRKVWEDQASLQSQDWAGLGGNWQEGRSSVLWTSGLQGLNWTGDLYLWRPWASVFYSALYFWNHNGSLLEWFWTSMQKHFQKRSAFFPLTRTWCLSFYSVSKTSEMPQHWR